MSRRRKPHPIPAGPAAYLHGGSIDGVVEFSLPGPARPVEDLWVPYEETLAAADDPGHGPAGPLLPTEAEIAKLPRAARRAFAGRCIARVAPLDPIDPATPPDDTAGVALCAAVAADTLVRAATTRTPVTRQLRAIRRDFDRISKLAAANGWADDTPVPPDAFGPMWPDGPPAWWPA